VAATSAEEHENAIRFDYPMFSAVKSSEELTEALRGAPVAARVALIKHSSAGGTLGA
jgi:hypothetical protein